MMVKIVKENFVICSLYRDCQIPMQLRNLKEQFSLTGRGKGESRNNFTHQNWYKEHRHNSNSVNPCLPRNESEMKFAISWINWSQV